MKKIARYITAAVLAACLFCMTAISTFAYTEGYFRYEITDGVLTITEYFGREENVTVPNMIAGTPVSVIGSGVFPDGCGVKTVNLPDTIMSVSEDSFGSSVNVVYAVIPEQTTTAAPVTEPSFTDNTGIWEDEPAVTATRIENGAVYIEEVTEDGHADEADHDIEEGGMEETEYNIDGVTAVTDVPDDIEEVPAEETTVPVKPTVEDSGTVSLSVNDSGQLVAVDESGNETVLDDSTGYHVSTGEDGNTVVLDDKGEPVKAEDIGVTGSASEDKAAEPAVSEKTPNNTAAMVLCIVGAAVVIAVVVIIFAKRKK